MIVLSMLTPFVVMITLCMVRKLKIQVDGIEEFEYELLGRVWHYGDYVLFWYLNMNVTYVLMPILFVLMMEALFWSLALDNLVPGAL